MTKFFSIALAVAATPSMLLAMLLAMPLLMLSGCQSPSRKPASHSAQVEAEAISAYHQQVSVNLLEEKRLRAEKDFERSQSDDDTQLKFAEERVQDAEKSLVYWKQSLARQSSSSQVPVLSKLDYGIAWRHQVEELSVPNLASYSLVSNQPARNYFMATQSASVYDLQLKHSVTDKTAALPVVLAAELSCDHNFELSLNGKKRAHSAGKPVLFSWGSEQSKSKSFLRLSNQNVNCSLKFKSQTSPSWSGIRLVPEAEQFGDLTKLTRQFQVCSLPSSARLSGVEKFFVTQNYSSMTCPESADFRLVSMPINGLTERIKILTGAELPQSAIDTRNPFVELDYSRAPKLDVIVVTSLVFRSDFYGQLLARALVWHAKRGAIVRILNSKVLELSKDRAMFKQMMAASDNIKVQSYAFDAQDGRIKSKINELHRVSHIKLFATYSRTQPAASAVIIGGRNVHEGYILPVAMERLGHPELVDYLKGEDSFLFYRDIEAIVQSHDYAETVISHFLTFWQRQPNAFTRSMSLNLASNAETDPNYFKSGKPLVRHVLSLPYKDNRELNDVYAELIDSAEREIKITTPYFMPTKKVGKALERALERGVDITLITTSEIVGDNPQFDHLTTTVNRRGINRYWDKLKIYDYSVPKSLLHSKLVLVDGKVSVIGSVNLNRRSFYHDVENASFIYSPAFTAELLAVYQDFLSLSKPIESKKRVGFLNKLIVSVFDKEL